ncbi:MAG: hypothetical protein AAF823_11855 [Planctomycetota bacterium]
MTEPESREAHGKLEKQLETLPVKPPDNAKQSDKKAYSETVSRVLALAVAAELRDRGLEETLPTESGLSRGSGAERRLAGGIGAKKVDVTWSTEDGGLMLAFSVKTINFRDKRSGNFQKNLTNRRGDLLFECITLHQRFPFAVLVGLFLLDAAAKQDQTDARSSTFSNAHRRLKLFDGRADREGRDEQFEQLYVVTLDTSGEKPAVKFYRVGQENKDLCFDQVVEDTLRAVAMRNPDFYEFEGGKLTKL